MINTDPVLVLPRLRLYQRFLYRPCCSREKYLTLMRKFASGCIFFSFYLILWDKLMLIKLRDGHSGLQQLGIEGLAHLSHNLSFLLIPILTWRTLVTTKEVWLDACHTLWALKLSYQVLFTPESAVSKGRSSRGFVATLRTGLDSRWAGREQLVSQTAIANKKHQVIRGRNCWEESGRDPSR